MSRPAERADVEAWVARVDDRLRIVDRPWGWQVVLPSIPGIPPPAGGSAGFAVEAATGDVIILSSDPRSRFGTADTPGYALAQTPEAFARWRADQPAHGSVHGPG